MLLGPGLPVQTQALLMWRCSQPRRCWRALPQAQPAAGSAAALLPPAAGRTPARPPALLAGVLALVRARLAAARMATAHRRQEPPSAALQPLRASHGRHD